MPCIFLSHSSADKVLAGELSDQIQNELSDCKIFVSSKPEGIPGGEWLATVLKNLNEADHLVVLVTPSSEKSMWVAYEYGYFWGQKGNQNIHVLHHPESKIPNPLDVIQSKSILNKDELVVFFQQLCSALNCTFRELADIDAIVSLASFAITKPPERSLARFEDLVEHANWDEAKIFQDKKCWICEDDALFQIVIGYDDERNEFHEPWVKKYPDQNAFKYVVSLMIGGVTIHEEYFISLDGGRIFVPMPEIESHKGWSTESWADVNFYWRRTSLRWKLARIIGEYYIYETIEGIAEHSGIQII